MATYYAVCNVYGPISKAIEADSVEEARAIFEAADTQAWIDGGCADAEDDLGIEGDSMTEDQFETAMEAAGYREVEDLAPHHSHDGRCTTHILDGWMLWGEAVK